MACFDISKRQFYSFFFFITVYMLSVSTIITIRLLLVLDHFLIIQKASQDSYHNALYK